MRSPVVVAIFVQRGGQVLLVRRTDRPIWHVPAGDVEPGEGLQDAASRELLEETGLRVPVVDLALPQHHPLDADQRSQYPAGTRDITIHNFSALAPTGWNPVLNEEHDAFEWRTASEARARLHWPQARDVARVLAERPSQS